MNFKLMKYILILLVLCISCQDVQSGPRRKLGTMAAPELLIPLGSIGTSLQGSNLASVTGVDAMYWNPAGIALIEGKSSDLMFSHMNYVADMSMQYFAGAIKIGTLGVLGASLRNLSFGDPIEVTTANSPEGTGATFSPTYLIGNVSFARAMTDKVLFGTNVKLISEKIADVSAVGYAFDFGIQYIAGQTGLRFGIAIKNLGPAMKFDGPGLDQTFVSNGQNVTRRINLQEFDLPTSLEIGLAYSRTFGKNNTIAVSSSFQNSGFTSDEYRFGLEYNYNNNFFLRGAFTVFPDKLQNESLFGPSFGGGFKYPFGNMTLGIDYAYRILNESGFDATNQFFTLHVGF
ncbi:MAG: PorV/PorQ family protein [Ignavibacteriae bacterium]|nr:MAG: PorV/PorQ family protein [Ignavibacteriota bacterium]